MKNLQNKNSNNSNQFLKDKKFSAIDFLFILFALFPLLPFGIKGAPVILLALFVISILKKKKKKFEYIYLINSTLYIIYFISIFYSDNSKNSLTLLETTLSLLIVPISFVLYSGIKLPNKTILKQEFIFKTFFIISSFVLSIFIFIISFEYGDYISTKIELRQFLSRLDSGFFWLKEHPIYLSIYLSISLLTIISLFKTSKRKIVLIVMGLFQFFILMLLSRKGVIISFLFTAVAFFLMIQKRKRIGLLFIVFFSVIASFFVFKYTPDTIKRFEEVFDVKSYNKIEKHSSTSIRYGVYKCALEKINESWVIGYGIGDVKSELLKCYEKKSKILVNQNLNSHNQYLGILLSVGLFGLLVFIIPLIINLRLFFINKDYFAFCLLLMFTFFMFFENILDRQNGVILFAFLLNFYTFKNYTLKKNE
ncbi:O-antigen ligase family protein [Polaribacter sp. IC073]|uniref:O-antigen ligase family protein n=1 Tax=Polaribacter sp. IC073 TaxID=2508540 RepID=UPI0011BEA1AE|nr:O-antigen ligase family protein [Polaribacter sp. IC073]TXD49696.1 O-antigen ligase family protein [Polaribacter sp. IC073]